MKQKKISEKKSRKASVICNILIGILLVVCLFSLFYPYISNHIIYVKQDALVRSYDNTVKSMDPAEKQRLLEEAREYNERLLTDPIGYKLSESQLAEYKNTFNVFDDGIMGRITIPTINVNLVIYHTADEAVLSAGVGHLPGSSLPVGGLGTNTILTGHTGLTTATLFSSLDRMEIGDVFYLTVLEDVLTYEVDKIDVVLPSELNNIRIEPDKDYCTLVTCTPYGINSHRLIVRGHRIETPPKDEIDNTPGLLSTLLGAASKRGGLDFSEILALGGIAVIIVTIVILILKLIRHRKRKKKNIPIT